MALGREREREFMDNYWTMEFHGDNQSIIYNPRFADDLERFFPMGDLHYLGDLYGSIGNPSLWGNWGVQKT
jgi:hypothetical protein